MKKAFIRIILIIITGLTLFAGHCEEDKIGFHFYVENHSSHDINNIGWADPGEADPDTNGKWFNVNLPPGYAFLIQITNEDFVPGEKQIIIYNDHLAQEGWFWNTTGHYLDFRKDENATIKVKDTPATDSKIYTSWGTEIEASSMNIP